MIASSCVYSSRVETLDRNISQIVMSDIGEKGGTSIASSGIYRSSLFAACTD
jgi:hypothetical protein